MPDTYTSRLKFTKMARGDPNWDVVANAQLDALDGLNALGGLAVALHEVPSSSLTIQVAAGSFRAANGTVVSYAGTASQAVTASVTTCLWLTDAGALATGSAFPAVTNLVRLASVVAGASTIASISDQRAPFASFGAAVAGTSPFVASGAGHAAGLAPDPGASAGTTHFLREDATWAVPPASAGTVTSVALSLPGIFTVSGSPVTGAGTLTAALAAQNPNLVLAGPPTGAGGAVAPTFRALVAPDIPGLDASQLVSGTISPSRLSVMVASGPSHASGTVPDPGSAAGSTRFLREDASWVTPAGAGTVTSVGLALPADFTVSGSPVTASGTLGATWATRLANLVFASPASGGAVAPAFRALVAADLPVKGLQIDSHFGALTAEADGATITFDLSVSDWHAPAALGGNRTLAVSGGTVGQQFAVVLQQPASGGPYTVTWSFGGTIVWFTFDGNPPVLAIGANKRTVVGFKFLDSGPTFLGFLMGAQV